jgi:iron complex outermembrane receptor protein
MRSEHSALITPHDRDWKAPRGSISGFADMDWRIRIGDALSGCISPFRAAENDSGPTNMQTRLFIYSAFLELPDLSCSGTVSRRGTRRLPILAGIALLALAGLPARAVQTPDLTQKSLEDLMSIEVTSVSKKEQKTSQAAAAIYVISRDDIRHSGVLNIPDLLRMVPGLDVAQIDAGKWAISSRGFNGQYSNKLLVLVDGRTAYSPIFAGVFWDSQNIPLPSIERIEVIRGPGAAVWGSNAVNGVINIITLRAVDTQGGYIAAGGGNASAGPEIIRYGGKLRNFGAYRVSAEGVHDSALPTFAGLNGQDGLTLVHGRFRVDSTLSAKDSVTMEGEAYQGNAGELAFVPVSLLPPENAAVALRDRYSGWNLLSIWKRTFSPGSETSLQVYFDRTTRSDTTYDIGQNIFDIDFQHHVVCRARQDIVWGLGYRTSTDEIEATLRISATPQKRSTQLFSWFAQDEIALLPDRIHMTLSARLEHNVYSGFNLQPSARLVWTLNSKNSVWGAVSGADRTPARADTGLRVNFEALPGPDSMPILVSLFGNPHQKNEQLTAFEAGYRTMLTRTLSLDSTVFYNRYRDLTSVEPGAMRIETDPAPIHLLMPESFGNNLFGETHGIEGFAKWKVARFWALNPGYTFFSTHLHEFAVSRDGSIPGTEGGNPNHQAQLRSSIRLPGNLQWNASAYFVNRLRAQSIPSYTRVDTGLIWHLGESVSLSLVGQNLLKDLHPEYSGTDSTVQPGLMRRAAYTRITWSF